MQTCKTCNWWVDGSCEIINAVGVAAEAPATRFEVECDAADDTGLVARLRTGPDFGCVLHVTAAADLQVAVQEDRVRLDGYRVLALAIEDGATVRVKVEGILVARRAPRTALTILPATDGPTP